MRTRYTVQLHLVVLVQDQVQAVVHYLLEVLQLETLQLSALLGQVLAQHYISIIIIVTDMQAPQTVPNVPELNLELSKRMIAMCFKELNPGARRFGSAVD